jgi:starch phosphorylase
VAASGKFSSDRTIAEYADGIWNVKACPVEEFSRDGRTVKGGGHGEA